MSERMRTDTELMRQDIRHFLNQLDKGYFGDDPVLKNSAFVDALRVHTCEPSMPSFPSKAERTLKEIAAVAALYCERPNIDQMALARTIHSLATTGELPETIRAALDAEEPGGEGDPA